MTIGRRMFEERATRHGLTEAAFGELCGHKADAVKKWESGADHPDAPSLAKLAEKGVDVYYILTGNVGPTHFDESELLAAYRRCPENVKQRIYADTVNGAGEEITIDLLNFGSQGKTE